MLDVLCCTKLVSFQRHFLRGLLSIHQHNFKSRLLRAMPSWSVYFQLFTYQVLPVKLLPYQAFQFSALYLFRPVSFQTFVFSGLHLFSFYFSRPLLCQALYLFSPLRSQASSLLGFRTSVILCFRLQPSAFLGSRIFQAFAFHTSPLKFLPLFRICTIRLLEFASQKRGNN